VRRDVEVYIEDIQESISKIEEYTKAVSRDDFFSNTQVQDAVLRRLEIMGEAVKNIPDEFKNRYPEIPWKKVAGLRDVLTHAYFGVNLERIWKIIEEDIPHLKSEMAKVRGS